MGKPESKTTAAAVVTMTIAIELSQPWGADCTLAQVQQQARREAEETMALLATPLRERGVRIGQVQAIRIVLNEERVDGTR